MDDETFPDYRAVRSGGVELTQEKNNLYVAFTRSKRWLYVTWPSGDCLIKYLQNCCVADCRYRGQYRGRRCIRNPISPVIQYRKFQ
jgi:superfamily I DNA/RNA helicase